MHDSGITAVAYSPNGNVFATASYVDVAIRLWDSASGEPRGSLPSVLAGVTGLAFSPDGTTLALSRRTGMPRCGSWNQAGGSVLCGCRRVRSSRSLSAATAGCLRRAVPTALFGSGTSQRPSRKCLRRRKTESAHSSRSFPFVPVGWVRPDGISCPGRPSRVFGEDVSPPTLVFYTGIWLSLDNLPDLKARRLEETSHLFRTVEDEVDRDLLSPPFVQVQDVIADVKSQEQQAPWSQDSLEFAPRR